jgi:hypothetical protein
LTDQIGGRQQYGAEERREGQDAKYVMGTQDAPRRVRSEQSDIADRSACSDYWSYGGDG